MSSMPRPRPPHLHRERNRHGTMVWYVREGKGPRIRIRAAYGTPEFQAEYQAALGPKPATVPRKVTGTLSWLVDRYSESIQFAELSKATQAQRLNVLKRVIRTAGDVPLSDIDRAAILQGMDRRRDTPAAARHFLKAMRYLFEYGKHIDAVTDNPADGIKAPKLPQSEGWHVWTDDECAAFEAHWPIGTRERLAFDVLLYTGLRRGDAVRFGRQHIGKDGFAKLKQSKTKADVSFLVLPPLKASIAATPSKGLTFIATLSGAPMTPASFGNWFREACEAAGVPGSAHGLRKTGATRAAQWLRPHEIMAMYGWADLRMASHYTRTVERDGLSRSGGGTLSKVFEK